MPAAAERGIVYHSEGQMRGNSLRSGEWMRMAQKLPFEVVPYVEGSHIVQTAPNEWVVTQDGAPLPGAPTYAEGKPLPMRAWYAPGAGAEAHRIMEKGRRPDNPLSTHREATLQETKNNFFSFLQISGRRGGVYGMDTNTVSAISTGLPWDRQTSYEDAARKMLRSIAGDENAPIVWFGAHKAIAVVHGSQIPHEMIQRLVDAPRDAYNEYLPHLANAVNALQDQRQGTILGSGGLAEKFEAYFNGQPLPLERAFQEDSDAEGMVWKYEQRGSQLVGINPDGLEQTMLSLAERGYEQDVDMKNKIVTANTNLNHQGFENTYFIEINFNEDATCCGFSCNSQRSDLDGGHFEPESIGDLNSYQVEVFSPSEYRLPERTKQACKDCGQAVAKEHNCQNTAAEELVGAGE